MSKVERKKICGIYRIVCKGKNYIGQSRDVASRWKNHKYNALYKIHKNDLYNDMNEYGVEKFSFELIQEFAQDVDQKILNDAEQEYIEKFDSRRNGYNVGREKKVKCVNTGEVFYSAAEARRKYGATVWSQLYCGYEQSRDEGLKFEWVEDGINEAEGRGRGRRVKCTTTGEVFDSYTAANRKYGYTVNQQLYYGQEQSKEGLKFEWLDKESTAYVPTKAHREAIKKAHGRAVKCLETGKIFPSVRDAEKVYGSVVRAMLSGKVYKNKPHKNLHFEYAESN